MGGRWSSTLGKVLAGVRVGVPARWITPGLVDEVLAEAGQAAAGQVLTPAGVRIIDSLHSTRNLVLGGRDDLNRKLVEPVILLV